MRGRLLVLLIIITSISFSFSCSGGGTSTSFKVIPSTHSYGLVAVPGYEDFDYVIKNGGSDIITIQQFNFTGANTSDFFISANGQVPQNLYARSEITITIRFRPTSKGTKLAFLEIIHNKVNTKPLMVKLTGSATTAPMIEVDPMSADFGSLWVQGKEQREFTVKSLGTEDLIITQTSIGGTNAAEFKIISAPTIPITVQPNGSFKMTVEWTAGNPPANKNATLNFQHNAAGNNTTVSLTATSIPYVSLLITTTSLSNGTVWTDYTDQLNFTGGNGNQQWSVKSGNFPAGLDINPTSGAITGKPAYPGTYDFTLQIDDQISQDDHTYHINVDKDGSWKDVTPNGFSINPRAAVANDEFDLYYFGGVNGTNGVSTIKVFDTKKNTFSTASVNLQNSRERAVAACLGKYIYIIGGRSNSTASGQTIQQVERYDTEKKTITNDSYMPSGGQYNTCCGVHNGKIYILGGASPNGNLVYEFTPGSGTSGGTWTTKANITLQTAGMGFVSYNSKMYIIGGFALGLLNEIYEYDPVLGQGATHVGRTVQKTGRMQYGFITDSLYMVDNVDNLQKFNFIAFTAHSSAYPACPIATYDLWSSQNVECMGRIYVTAGDAPSTTPTMLTQVYAYCP